MRDTQFQDGERGSEQTPFHLTCCLHRIVPQHAGGRSGICVNKTDSAQQYNIQWRPTSVHVMQRKKGYNIVAIIIQVICSRVKRYTEWCAKRVNKPQHPNSSTSHHWDT
uniref:Uncharacterized protein n=1 Tax=Percolomonas cosmopolitus TaxID=63605 RepID=A0A7S1PKK7_9EUKA